MDLQAYFNDPDLMLNVSTFIVGIIRISVFVSMVPFFGPQVTGAIIYPIAVALYIPIHPVLMHFGGISFSLASDDFLTFFLIIAKEVLIGYLLAFICSTFFYIALASGTIIDNQRGASMAQGSDIMSGAESTPLGSALFVAVVCLFFTSGAFMNLLSIFYSTYIFWPPQTLLPGFLYNGIPLFSAHQVDFLMTQAILVAAPFMLVALLCDISLGLMNRFAPQLNVFILSMPIKSGACALLIIFYLGPFLNHQQYLFNLLNNVILSLRQFLG